MLLCFPSRLCNNALRVYLVYVATNLEKLLAAGAGAGPERTAEATGLVANLNRLGCAGRDWVGSGTGAVGPSSPQTSYLPDSSMSPMYPVELGSRTMPVSEIK